MSRKARKQTNAAKVLAKIAAEQGIAMDASSLYDLKDSLEKLKNKGGESSLEAESVLKSMHKPHALMMKKCKNKTCGMPFQTGYCYVSYCSTACLAADLRAIGIEYDPYRHRNGIQYQYEAPEFISTETLLQLEEWATRFLADLDRLRGIAQERESQQTQKTLEDSFQDLGLFGEELSEPLETLQDTPIQSDPEKSEDNDPLSSFGSSLQTTTDFQWPF